MTTPIYDPFGETDYQDWEDPLVHKLTKGCPGCADCVGWHGKTYDQINAARINLVVGRRRRDTPEPTAREVAQEDREYWADRYDD